MRLMLAPLFIALASPVLADGIVIDDAYGRVARPGAPTGAVFMTIQNDTQQDDRLIGVESPIAKRVELHTHIEEDGIMKMRKVEAGFLVMSGGTRELARGGDHVMLMGLGENLTTGDSFPLTLIFEDAGELTITVTVDTERGQVGNTQSD